MASIQFKKGKGGKKVYYVVVSLSGRHKWIRAGTQQQARVLKKNIENLQENQKVEKLGLTRREKRIEAFFSEYLDYVSARASLNTVKRYRAAVNAFLAFLGLYCPRIQRLSQLRQEHVEKYQLRRLDSIELKIAADGDKPGVHRNKKLPKPQTVNYEVAVLGSAFVWAQDRELLSRVPTAKVKKLKVARTRKARILTTEESKALLRVAREITNEDKSFLVYQLAFQFLLNTGLRSGELCHLTWDDVDLASGLIRIQPKSDWTPKSYSRAFYLNSICLKILKRIGPGSGYVFLRARGSRLDSDRLRRGLIRAARVAGIEGLTRVHDLRHTFSSVLQMKGVDPGTVAAILGHQDLGTTRIYTHQTEEHLRKSIGKIGV